MNITAAQQSPAMMKTVRRHTSTTQRQAAAVSIRSSDRTAEVPSGRSNNTKSVTTENSVSVSHHASNGSPNDSDRADFRAGAGESEAGVHEAKLSQLQHFIVSRFERLPLDDQRILKNASVIGFDFSRYVLYGILSPGLKPHLNIALKNLVKEKWITKAHQYGSSERPTKGSNGIVSSHDAEYVFAHAMAWDTLYNLIPPGDRKEIHQMVASYY
eukprot:gene13186-16121_t